MVERDSGTNRIRKILNTGLVRGVSPVEGSCRVEFVRKLIGVRGVQHNIPLCSRGACPFLDLLLYYFVTQNTSPALRSLCNGPNGGQQEDELLGTRGPRCVSAQIARVTRFVQTGPRLLVTHLRNQDSNESA